MTAKKKARKRRPAAKPTPVTAGELAPNPENPRTIKAEALERLGRSMHRYGDLSGFVFNRRSRHLIGGHQRNRHMPPDAEVVVTERFPKPTEVGTTAVGYVILDGERWAFREVDVDATTEGEMNIAANAHGGDFDRDALAAQLGRLKEGGSDLADVGLEDRALNDLLRDQANVPDAPARPLPRQAKSKPGQRYELGPHRLYCGDAREPAAWEQLVADRPLAEAIWTDPPYGLEYEGGTAERLTIEGDQEQGLRELIVAVFAQVTAHAAPGARFYVAAPAGPLGTLFRLAIGDAGWRFHQGLVWVKDRFVLGHSDYHYRHEDILHGLVGEPPYAPRHCDILYGYLVGGEGRPGRGSAKWQLGNREDSVFEVPRPARSAEHPTMKPPAMIAHQLKASTRPGDIVLDPFAGSGSTLVAADGLGRRALLMELRPDYADVIRQRYADLVDDQRFAP